MQPTRTPAWLVVRLELMLGIGLTVLIGLVAWSSPFVIDYRGNPAGLDPLASIIPFAVPITAFGIAVMGLIWMVRIFRGPRDEPPPWRYRDL